MKINVLFWILHTLYPDLKCSGLHPSDRFQYSNVKCYGVCSCSMVCVISTVVCEVLSVVIFELGLCEDFSLCKCVSWECVDTDNQKKKLMS